MFVACFLLFSCSAMAHRNWNGGDGANTSAVADGYRHRHRDVRTNNQWTDSAANPNNSWQQQSAVADWWPSVDNNTQWWEREWPSREQHKRTEESGGRWSEEDWSEEDWAAWRRWKQSQFAHQKRDDINHEMREVAANNEEADEQPQSEPKESEHSEKESALLASSQSWEGLDGRTPGVDSLAAPTAVADVRSIPDTHVDVPTLPVKAPSTRVQHSAAQLQVPPPPPLKENAPPPPKAVPPLPLEENPSSQASLASLPPQPLQTRLTSPPPATSHALPAASSQQAPQSRSFADGDATETRPEGPMRVPPGLGDNDWNLTLDRIKGAKVFDARFYKALFAERRTHDTFKQHNGAAKWFRQVCIDGGRDVLVFEDTSAVAVKKVHHYKGMNFKFLDEDVHWIWHEMIGQLDNASIDKVCKSPLVQCDFALRGKQKGPGGDFVWDFRLHRQDGTMMTLHPDWSRRTFQALEFADERDGHDELAAVDTYGADGKKCKHFRKSLGSIKLHFDPQKEPSNTA